MARTNPDRCMHAHTPNKIVRAMSRFTVSGIDNKETAAITKTSDPETLEKEEKYQNYPLILSSTSLLFWNSNLWRTTETQR